MKPHCTLRRLLVHPKDKREPRNTTDVVYSIPCQNCDKVYVGETGRKLGLRVNEQKSKAEEAVTAIRTRAQREAARSVINKSATTNHVVETNHIINWDEARIEDNEAHRFTRWVKEAIAIRKQDKTMNRDEGQYFLSHVYDDLLKSSRNTNNVSKQPTTSVHNRRSSLHN